MPWFMSTQTGVIWEQETLTKKMHPPQWSMDKPMVYFFFSSFLHSDILFMGVGLLRQGFSSNSDIHLPLLPECLNKRHTPPCPANTFVWWCGGARLTMGGVIPGDGGPQCIKKGDWNNHGEQDNKQYSSLNSAFRFLLPWLPWMM